MIVRILGSAAGGGFPQWNCACANCSLFRAGRLKAKARSQSQLAVSRDGSRWILLNASPDLRDQIHATRALWPRASADLSRHSPIAAAVITNADLDHTMGLLLLRESQPFRVYATESVRRVLCEDNSYYGMLAQYADQTRWSDFRAGEPFDVRDHDGQPLGLRITPVGFEGRYPRYVNEARARALRADEAVCGLIIEEAPQTEETADGRAADARERPERQRIAYLPGLPALGGALLERIGQCSAAFVDGTFWTEEELRAVMGSASVRTASQMGHIPISGPTGSMNALATLKSTRVVYVHINNTNPILDEESDERRAVERAGLTVGEDGLELEL